jgi:hypothetical protein
MDRIERDRTSQVQRIAAALRARRRPIACARVARRGQTYGANAIFSFGMTLTLLMIWAMAVHL